MNNLTNQRLQLTCAAMAAGQTPTFAIDAADHALALLREPSELEQLTAKLEISQNTVARWMEEAQEWEKKSIQANTMVERWRKRYELAITRVAAVSEPAAVIMRRTRREEV